MTNKSVLPLHTVTFIPKRVIFYRSKLFHTDFRSRKRHKRVHRTSFRCVVYSSHPKVAKFNSAYSCSRPGVLFINVIIYTLDLRKTRDGRNSFSL